jgi:hypothetical protein
MDNMVRFKNIWEAGLLFVVAILLLVIFHSCKNGSNSISTDNSVPNNNPVSTDCAAANRTGAICNDGTTSTATGSGACSSHGGVKNWICR